MRTTSKAVIFLFTLTLYLQGSNVKISNLRCEYKQNPIGIDISNPRFSWNIKSDKRGIRQTAYQILVSTNIDDLLNNIGDIWDSKKVISDKSIQIFFEGKPLRSNRKYFWKVNVWDSDGKVYSSEPAFWKTGLLSESDWKAKWIGLDKAIGSDAPDAPHRKLSARMLRHEFNNKKEIKEATVFISGLGLYEFYINGQKIGDQVLAPALTEYNKKAFYNTFDVTKNIKKNNNAIGIILGNGRFFAPRTSEPVKTRTYGYPKVICQLELLYKDGTRQTIITDETWKLTTDGPIRKNNEYDGEFYDARMEKPGWNKVGFDDTNWMNAELVKKPCEHLVAQPNEFIKIMDELTPISVNEISPGKFIFDMGQNMVGWVELLTKGKRGDTVKLRFAETLNDDGSLFLANIREAEVTDTYVLKGKGLETWQPRFTYHGFRFVEVTGFPGTPTIESIKGKVVHDALEVTGSFECSNPLINKIYKNAYWGIRGNYRSIPTDCPQRDERQGWLGDRAAECTGESFIFDISKLYNKWLGDMKDAQKKNGSIPDVAPSYWPFYNDNTTWAGTYLFVADMLYNQYGDLKAVQTHYPSMKKWISHMSKFLVNDIMPKDTYGDWCVPPEDLKLIHTNDPLKTTSAEFIGTAYFYYELNLMAKFAALLGKENDVLKYSKRAEKMKTAFNSKFFNKQSLTYGNNSHTVNILALAFNLVPKEYEKQIVKNLLEKILGENKKHVGNGIVGGQWLMRTLSNNGHEDIAYVLAAQNTYPSWGYMVKQGATTIWELWNGDNGDPAMNSGNHVMLLGDLIIWFYENLAGIKTDPVIPAFKHIIMKPEVVGDLSFVKASYKSVYGKIKSEWKLTDDNFLWNVNIPANTTATVYVPTSNKENVYEGKNLAKNSEGVKFVGWNDYSAIFEIASGSYSFSSNGVNKKITKDFVSVPVLSFRDTILTIGDKLYLTITCEDSDAVIKFTLDNSEPDENSMIYTKPIEIKKTTILKAQAFKDSFNPSVVSKAVYDFIEPDINGIEWKLYKGRFKKIPDFKTLKKYSDGTTYQFDMDDIITPRHNFAVKFKSNIFIKQKGEYRFYILSNDGSNLFIDNKLIVNNDGEHGPKQLSGSINLTEGKHPISVEYFQSGGSKTLKVYYSSGKLNYQTIPASVLFK